MSSENNSEIRKKIKITQPEQLYQIKDEQGNIIDLEQANGQELFDHYRHSMTNYDDVLNDIRNGQGYVTYKQQKQAVLGAADQVLQTYKDEHIKVVKIINECGLNASIDWVEVPEWLLNRVENTMISFYQPKFNAKNSPIV